jgi:hypothetical protein
MGSTRVGWDPPLLARNPFCQTVGGIICATGRKFTWINVSAMNHRLSLWDLMRRGESDAALSEMRAAAANSGKSSHIMELGVAYLWIKDYDAAFAHFQSVNEARPKHASVFYGMAGVAKWCLGDAVAAVGCWNAGLTCRYADAAGGARLPLLLFCASVLTPNVVSESETRRLLAKHADDQRARNWPGPLLDLALRRITPDELMGKCIGVDRDDKDWRRWLAQYCAALSRATLRDAASSDDAVRHTGSASWDEFDSRRRLFLTRLWSEEFYIARHECFERTSKPA